MPLRKKHKSRRLTPSDIVEIVHRVFIEHEYQTDLAREYHVLVQTVCRLVNKVKKQPTLLSELLAAHSEKEALRASTSEAIQSLLDRGENLLSSAGVSARLREEKGLVVKPSYVRAVMKNELFMSYRKVGHLTMQ